MEQVAPYQFQRREDDETAKLRQARKERAVKLRRQERVEQRLATDALQLAYA